MIRVFHPGSGSWHFTHSGSRSWILDLGSKRHRIPDPDPQHWRFRICSGCSGSVTGDAAFTTHLIDQLLEAFMCKKEFSLYFISTQSLWFFPILSYDAPCICFLTHLVHAPGTDPPLKVFRAPGSIIIRSKGAWSSLCRATSGQSKRRALRSGLRTDEEARKCRQVQEERMPL